MFFKKIHPNFIMPTKGTEHAGAWDIYMPEPGSTTDRETHVNLGFAAEVPSYCVALIVPRSGVGFKNGLELNNTCGVIDSDYRGEWKAAIRTKNGQYFTWNKHDRLLQFLIVPIHHVNPQLVEELSETKRDTGGIGSTGK